MLRIETHRQQPIFTPIETVVFSNEDIVATIFSNLEFNESKAVLVTCKLLNHIGIKIIRYDELVKVSDYIKSMINKMSESSDISSFTDMILFNNDKLKFDNLHQIKVNTFLIEEDIVGCLSELHREIINPWKKPWNWKNFQDKDSPFGDLLKSIKYYNEESDSEESVESKIERAMDYNENVEIKCYKRGIFIDGLVKRFFFNMAIEETDNISLKVPKYECLINISEQCIKNQLLDKAEDIAIKTSSLITEMHLDVAEKYLELGKTYETLKQYTQALKYYQLGLNSMLLISNAEDDKLNEKLLYSYECVSNIYEKILQ